tara:strand:- start:430 stop:1227 length:798 start_codon:yes stop_codon:yes gene_type:complete
MNQSVIVFANSTARDAALPTPTEGMLTYLEDTNNYQYWDATWQDLVTAPDLSTLIPKSTVTTAGDLIVADGASSVTRLGAGTDDQVLTLASGLPVWADAGGGGGGATLISTTSLAGSGSVTIGSIPQTFTDLRLVIDGYYTGTNDNGVVTVFKSGASYVSAKTLYSYNNGSSTVTFLRNSSYPIFTPTSNASSQSGSALVIINNYSSTTLRKQFTFYGTAQGSNHSAFFGSGGTHGSTTAIDGLEIVLNATSTFSGGTAYLYGVN